MNNYDAIVDTLTSDPAAFQLSGPLAIGKMTRVKRSGSKQKGWYVLHEITLDDGERTLIGSYGYWEGAEKFVDKIAPGKGATLSVEQRRAIATRHRE